MISEFYLLSSIIALKKTVFKSFAVTVNVSMYELCRSI